MSSAYVCASPAFVICARRWFVLLVASHDRLKALHSCDVKAPKLSHKMLVAWVQECMLLAASSSGSSSAAGASGNSASTICVSASSGAGNAGDDVF